MTTDAFWLMPPWLVLCIGALLIVLSSEAIDRVILIAVVVMAWLHAVFVVPFLPHHLVVLYGIPIFGHIIHAYSHVAVTVYLLSFVAWYWVAAENLPKTSRALVCLVSASVLAICYSADIIALSCWLIVFGLSIALLLATMCAGQWAIIRWWFGWISILSMLLLMMISQQIALSWQGSIMVSPVDIDLLFNGSIISFGWLIVISSFLLWLLIPARLLYHYPRYLVSFLTMNMTTMAVMLVSSHLVGGDGWMLVGVGGVLIAMWQSVFARYWISVWQSIIAMLFSLLLITNALGNDLLFYAALRTVWIAIMIIPLIMVICAKTTVSTPAASVFTPHAPFMKITDSGRYPLQCLLAILAVWALWPDGPLVLWYRLWLRSAFGHPFVSKALYYMVPWAMIWLSAYGLGWLFRACWPYGKRDWSLSWQRVSSVYRLGRWTRLQPRESLLHTTNLVAPAWRLCVLIVLVIIIPSLIWIIWPNGWQHYLSSRSYGWPEWPQWSLSMAYYWSAIFLMILVLLRRVRTL